MNAARVSATIEFVICDSPHCCPSPTVIRVGKSGSLQTGTEPATINKVAATVESVSRSAPPPATLHYSAHNNHQSLPSRIHRALKKWPDCSGERCIVCHSTMHPRASLPLYGSRTQSSRPRVRFACTADDHLHSVVSILPPPLEGFKNYLIRVVVPMAGDCEDRLQRKLCWKTDGNDTDNTEV